MKGVSLVNIDPYQMALRLAAVEQALDALKERVHVVEQVVVTAPVVPESGPDAA